MDHEDEVTALAHAFAAAHEGRRAASEDDARWAFQSMPVTVQREMLADAALVLERIISAALAADREAAALLARIVKYAREDRARTPGVTRLARALSEADQLLAALRTRPAPGEGEPDPQASLDGSADALAMVAEERARQIAKLGYTAEHDDEHDDGAIAWAAACYAAPERIYVKDETSIGVRFRDPFPWSGDARMRKGNVVAPEKASLLTRIGLLVKAGALIAAEIDRLMRKAAPRGEGGERG